MAFMAPALVSSSPLGWLREKTRDGYWKSKLVVWVILQLVFFFCLTVFPRSTQQLCHFMGGSTGSTPNLPVNGQSLKYLPAKRDITRYESYDPSPSRVTPHSRGVFFWEPLGSVDRGMAQPWEEGTEPGPATGPVDVGAHIQHSHCRVPVCPNHMCKHHLHPPCLFAEIKPVEHMAQVGWNMVKEFTLW